MVSIIIPVFNVERCLSVCIDSIRRQTDQNFEVICVNDSSTDRSREVLSLYEKVDSRVKVIDVPNGGPSAARNAGLAASSGDIVWFVDSDDILEQSAIATIRKTFAETGADMVTFGAVCYPSFYGNPWLERCLSPEAKVYEGFCEEVLESPSHHPFVWRTAFSKSFVEREGLNWDENLRFGEDEALHFTAYPLSRKTVILPDKLYKYRVSREGSLMDSRADAEALKIHDHIRVVEHICREWNSHGICDLHGDFLLRYIAEFVFIDAVRLPRVARLSSLNYLSNVLECFFTVEQIDRLCKSARYGLLAVAITKDRSFAFGLKRRYVLYRATLVNRPGEMLHRIAAKIGRVAKLSGIVRRMRDILPASKKTQLRLFEEQVWNAREIGESQVALSLLRMEACEKSNDQTLV